MCVVDLRPISMVDGRSFNCFTNNLSPYYPIPSKTTVTKYVNYVFTEVKREIISDMLGCSTAITSEMWISAANQSCTWPLNQRLATERYIQCNSDDVGPH